MAQNTFVLLAFTRNSKVSEKRIVRSSTSRSLFESFTLFEKRVVVPWRGDDVLRRGGRCPTARG